MEQQFAEMQQALGELQEKLAEKDVQIAMYKQDLSSVNEHSTVGWALLVWAVERLWWGGWVRHTPVCPRQCGLHTKGGEQGGSLSVQLLPTARETQ